MTARGVIYAALCVSATVSFARAAAPDGIRGGGRSADDPQLSPQELQDEAQFQQSAQPTREFYQAVANRQASRDRASASCAHWAVVTVDFRDSQTKAALASGPSEFFTSNNEMKPDPRGCGPNKEPTGAESVTMYGGRRYVVLAVHFWRVEDAGPKQNADFVALDAAVFAAKQCVQKEGVDPHDVSSLAECVNNQRPGQAPWVAFLILSPALAGRSAASDVPEQLPLQVTQAKLGSSAEDGQHTFYVLSK